MNAKSLVMMSAVAAALSASGPAWGQEHEHGHAEAGKGGPKLTLDHGKKWQTSEPLRAGMNAVRDELQAALGPIHAKTYSPEDYQRLAERTEAKLTTIITTCKLPAEVDAQYHLVLAQLFDGTGQMKKDGDRLGGAVKLVKALAAYAEHFEHPDWKPIQH